MTPEVPPTDSPRRGIVRRSGGWIASRPAAIWNHIRPGDRVRRAMSLIAMTIVVGYGAFAGSRLHTGLGFWPDLGIGAGVALAVTLLVPLTIALLQFVSRVIPQALGLFGAGALVAMFALLDQTAFSSDISAMLAAATIVPAAMWFGALAAMTQTGFGKRGLTARACIVLCCIAGLTANGGLVWWITEEGSDARLTPRPVLAAESAPSAKLTAESPAKHGGFAWKTLTYGSGEHRHREEFGAKVDIRTPTVNGRPFVEMPSGWKGKVRESYWGFDAGHLPLNGRIWHPIGDGPFPLVLCVHGNHRMWDSSDPGYAYLGELFASRGFLFVSIDQNFLNSGGKAHGSMRKENDARAWMLLEHLALWRKWNSTPDSPFNARVDLANIALIGHSRGGEAVCLAAVFNKLDRYPDDASVEFNYGFDIRGVVSIAPVDGQYRAASHDTAMRDVNYFAIHGGHDADVTSFHGDKLYRRLAFSDAGHDFFKSTLWLYRANHGQFNTVWGPHDAAPPSAWFLNEAALMDGKDQRQIAKVFIGGFLEATLHDRREYRELFKDPRTAGDLVPANALLISRYEDPTFRLIADFEEDVDVTTTSVAGGTISAHDLAVWRESDIPLRKKRQRRDHGVVLGWDNSEREDAEASVAEASTEAAASSPSYELRLPDGAATQWSISNDDVLVFALAASKEKPEANDYSDPEEEDQQDADGENESPDEAESESDEQSESDDDEPTRMLDLTLELTDAAGNTSRRPLRDFGGLCPPLDVIVRRDNFRPSKWQKTFEPILQTFRCPLTAFATDGFDATQLRRIRFVFDETEKGVVFLDRVGLARP